MPDNKPTTTFSEKPKPVDVSTFKEVPLSEIGTDVSAYDSAVNNAAQINKSNAIAPTGTAGNTRTSSGKEAQDLKDLNVNFLMPGSSWKNQAAINQSTLEQVYNAGHQIVVGHGVGGTIAGIGYIAALAQGAKAASSTDSEFSNAWTDFGNAMLENSQQDHQIRKINPDEFDLGDPASWAQGAADIGSMLSMVIPTGAVIKGLGLVAKGLTLSSKFAKAANAAGIGAKYANLAVKGISSAVISRHIEASMEAEGKYKETFNKYKALGYSDEEAKQSASNVAATTYRGNWAMLAQDIPQYLTLYSKLGGSVTKAVSKGFGKAVGTGIKATIIDSIGEGVEEGYQFLLGETASASEDIRSGLASADYGNSYRLKKDLQKDEFLNSVISGMFGSTIIQGSASAIGAYTKNFTDQGKEAAIEEQKYNDDKLDLIQKYAHKFSKINESIKVSEDSGDMNAAVYHRKELNTQLALKSSELGNIDKHIEFLEGLQNENIEEYNAKNGTAYTEDFKDQLSTMISDSKKIGELVEEGARKYGQSLGIVYAEAKFNLENKDSKRKVIDGTIASELATLPLLSNFSVPGQTIASNTIAIEAGKTTIKNLNILKESDITESKRRSVEDTIKKIEQKNSVLEKGIQNAEVLDRSTEEKKSDSKLLDALKNTPNNLSNKVAHRAILDLDVSTAIDTLSVLNKDPSKIDRNKILQKIDSANTIEELEKLSNTLPIEEYEETKEVYRNKLESKYSEIKQKEDNIKRETLEKEISVSTSTPGKGTTHEDTSSFMEVSLSDIGKQPEAVEITPKQLEADVFKIDPNSTSEFTNLLYKQGVVINSGFLKDGDSFSMEVDNQDIIFYGKKKGITLEPSFIYSTVSEILIVKKDDNWEVDGEIIDSTEVPYIESIVQTVLDDMNSLAVFETQVFTPKQNDIILQAVNSNQTVISKEVITESTFETPEYTEDHNVELEEEVSKFYDPEIRENLQGARIAYTSDLSDPKITIEGKNLLELFHTPIPFSEKLDGYFILSVDKGEFLKSEDRLELDGPGEVSNVGNIPIKITFTGKNGNTYNTYLYTSNGLIKLGYNSEAQINNLLALRQSVIANYKLGTDTTTFLDTERSVLGGRLPKEGKLLVYSNVLDSFDLTSDEISLRITTKNYYIKPDGTEDYTLPFPKAAPGSVFIVIKDTNGKGIPLQLKNNKIKEETASLIYGIYTAINKGNRKDKISDKFKELYDSPFLNQLLNVLGSEATYNSLLENIVYEGKKETASKIYPLYLSEGMLTYGSTTVKIESLDVSDFISYLTTNKHFQINRSLIHDTEYKDFLFNNGILATNRKAVKGSVFVHPTIVLSVEEAKPRISIEVQQEVLPETKEDESKPTTVVRNLDTIVKDFDSVKIAPSIAETINEVEAINWLKNNLNMVPVEIQDDVIEIFKNGTQSIGRFTEGMIKLSRLASTGTEYHEAFHAVSQLYLSKKEREGVYSTVRKIENKELSDTQCEELLADEFEYYVKTKGLESYKYVKSIDSQPLSFFGKLLQLIKSVFSNQVTVDKIFKNITSGYYKNKSLPTSISNVTSYDKRVDNLSLEQVADITNYLTYTAFAAQDLSFESIANLDFNKAGYNLLAVYSKLDDSFKARYKRVFDSLFRKDWKEIFNNTSITNEELKNISWIDYNSDIFENIKDNLRVLGIETKLTEEKEIEEDESKDDNISPLVTKASYNYSNKETSRNSTKLLVANSPAIDGYDSAGKTIYIKDTFFGLPKIANFATTWGFLEDLLADIHPEEVQDGFEIMLDKIKNSLIYKPELTKLYTNLVNGSDVVRTQFYTDMNLVKNNFSTTFITKTWNSSINRSKYFWNYSKGNTKNITDRIIADWSSKVDNNYSIGKGLDIDKIVSTTSKLSVIENTLKDNNIVLTDSNLDDIIKEVFTVLNEVGITFISLTSLKYTIATMPSKELRYKIKDLLTSNTYGIDFAIEKLSKGESAYTVLPNEKGITYIALQESKFRKDGFESSITGAEGNKKYIYSYGNFFNKAISAMKNSKSTLFTKLQSTTYFKNSVWAKQVSRGEVSANKIEGSIFSSLKVKGIGDSGSDLTNLSSNEELSDIINRIISNIDKDDNRLLYSTGLAKADKSTDVLISGFKAIKAEYNNKTLGTAGTSILNGYVIDELNRIRQSHEDVNNWKEAGNSSDLIEYYHYDPNNKDVFDKSGGAFRTFLFPELSPKQLKENNKELYDTLYDEEGVPFPITEKTSNNKLLTAYIHNSFETVLNFEIKQGLDVGVLTHNTEGTLENVSLDDSIVSNRAVIIGEQNAVISLFADYLLNGLINNVETTKFLHGDPAFYKGKANNPFADIKKRTPLVLASGRQLRIYKDSEGNYVVKPKYTSVVLEDSEEASYYYNEEYIKQLAEIYSEFNNTNLDFEFTRLKDQFSSYNKVNETDAQAYITIDRYRETQLGWGKWENKHQEAFDAIKEWQKNPTNDNLNIARELSIFSELAMQPLKSVHTGLEFQDSNPNVAIVEYNKQSETILNPIFTAGLPLDKIRKAMEEQSVDHAIFKSGKKVGTQGPTTISKDGNILDNIVFNKIKSLSNSNYYLQQDLPVHGFDESLEGSQIYKVVQTNVVLGHTYNNGMTGASIIKELNNTQSKLSNIGIDELKKELDYTDTEGWTEKSLSKLRKSISESLTKRGATDSVREALQDSSYPFSAIVQSLKKVSNTFNSMVNTAGIKLKMPGGPLIQISGFGIARPTAYTDLDNSVKGGIMWLGNKELAPPRLIKTETGLTFLKGQILVPHNIIKDIPNWETMSKEELMNNIDPKVLTAIGYRIPNQGPSSNDVLEIVGILPEEAGDSVVLYNEVTTKTGADFDIDKMYIMVPNYEYKNNKLRKVEYDTSNLTKKGLQNYKLDLYTALLSDISSYLSVVAPLDSDFLSSTINQLHDSETVENKNLMFMSPGYQYIVKTSFRGGKTGIGVLANNIVDHTQGQIYNLKVNGLTTKQGNQTEFDEPSLAGTDCEPTKDGKVYKISEVLSWYANAFVDIAKDPYITKGNINDVTLSTTMLLTRLGFAPDWVIAFIGQPIIKDYVQLTYAQKGRVKKYDDIFKTLNEKYKEESDIIYTDISTSTLEGFIKNKDIENQRSVLNLFLSINKSATALQEQIRATKQDVNGAGKSNTEAFTISELREKVLKENKIGNVDTKFKDTSLETAYNNSIGTLQNMFGSFLFTDHFVTKEVMKRISQDKGSVYATNLELNEKVSTEFYSYIASGLPFFKNTNLRELLYGNNSLAKKVYDWKFNPNSPIRDNVLVQYLESVQEAGAPNTVGINQFRDKSILIQNQITQAWEELLGSDNANIKKTAEDLVRYAFYSSGFNPTSKAIFEYIPYKYMKQIGFGAYMDDFMKYGNSSIIDNFVDQFYQNNNTFEAALKSNRNIEDLKNGNFTIGEDTIDKFIIGYSIENGTVQKEYVRYFNGYGKVYKLKGYTSDNLPVYQKLSSKGITTDSNYKIVEYSFESNPESIFTSVKDLKEQSKVIDIPNLSLPRTPNTESILDTVTENNSVMVDNTNSKIVKNKDLEFIFNENPTLKEIGTKKQYSNYLNTIFPDSTLTDIVYHGTDNKNKILEEGFKNNSELFNADDDRHYEIGELGNGYYFTPSIDSAKNYGEIISALINNPDVENKTTFNNITNEQETQYFVKSKKQIHILGTEQDIEEFKKYVEKDVSLEESVDLENDNTCGIL